MHADVLRRRYKAQEAVFRQKVALIKLNRLAPKKSLYEATRYAWRVNVKRIWEVDYGLAVVNGTVRGAFVAERCLPATSEKFPGCEPMPDRWGIEGRGTPLKIVSIYRHRRVPGDYRRKGAVSPIKYPAVHPATEEPER